MHRSIMGLLLLSACLSLVVGCGSPAATGPATAAPTVAKPNLDADIGVDVGVPVNPPANPNDIPNLLASESVHTRVDPFALTPQEVAFDRAQTSERLVSQDGPMMTLFEPPGAPTLPVLVEEQQPYRRVSGIIVGDAVYAVIEMGDNQPPHIVHPGDRIGEWVVVSIDEERVILRRGGNVNPKEVEVRLEQLPPGAGGGGGASSGAGAATGGGGRPPGGPQAAGQSGGASGSGRAGSAD